MTDPAQNVRDSVAQSRRRLPSSPELTCLEDAALEAAVCIGELGEALANSQGETEEVGRLNAVAEDALTDRIEALERALVTARTALEQTEWVGPTLKCPWCDGSGIGGQGGHNDGCKRQQALTKIDGVGITGAEPVGVQP